MPHPETRTRSIMLEESITPTALTPGQKGFFTWDDDFLYLYTSVGWKKVALTTI